MVYVHYISHIMREQDTFLTFDEFGTKYNININLITYFGSIHAFKSYMTDLNIDIIINKAVNKRKASQIICSVNMGAKWYYDILTMETHQTALLNWRKNCPPI